MNDAFFRAGVGAVVIDARRRILVLERKGVAEAAWQLPQGGIGENETPVDALYRELEEETGLARPDIEVVKTTSEWLVYELPPPFRNRKVGWGQTQRWFLCRLIGRPDLVRPDQIEFSAAAWVSAEQLLARAIAFRLALYRRLVTEFEL